MQNIQTTNKNLCFCILTINYLKKTKKTILFTIASKTMKYLGTNLKEVKDLYTSNYRTMIKETEKDTNKWKFFSCS